MLRLTALVSLLASGASWACTCQTTAAEEAVRRPELAVFAGRVTRVLELGATRHAVIEVRRSWGARLPSMVLMPLEVTTCGHPDVWSTFPTDWLFVAERTGLARYETSNCLGNLRMVDAADTLTHLGPGQPPWPVAPAGIAASVLLIPSVALGVWGARRRRSAAA